MKPTPITHLCKDEPAKEQRQWTTLCGILVTTTNETYAYYVRDYIDYTARGRTIEVNWCEDCRDTDEYAIAMLAAH